MASIKFLHSFVMLIRSKSKVLRNNLGEAAYSRMFHSLNFRCRRGRRAADRAVEAASQIIERESESDDPDYNSGDDVADQIVTPPRVTPPRIEEPPVNAAASVTRRSRLNRAVSWLQIIFYGIGILLLVYICFNQFFNDDDDMEILVRRRRHWLQASQITSHRNET